MSSQLWNEQRLSRSRRLPVVIADIFDGAQNWSVREQQGFYDEISKSMEKMLILENESAWDAMSSMISPLLESYDSNDTKQAKRIVAKLESMIPNEVSKSPAVTREA